MTQPKKDPLWIRNASIESYGCTVDFHDYGGVGKIDPNTDSDASEWMSMTADVSAMDKTIPFARITLTCNDSSPAAPTIVSYWAVHGTDRPTVARVGNGHFTIEWASSYYDPYGQEGVTNLIDVTATVRGSAACFASAEFSSVKKLDVYVWGSSFAAALDKKVTVVVW